jgi:undecaprenyl-diphosphatase
MPEIDTALTAWINASAGRLPPVDFIMIWISAIGVPLLVVAVALQWWVPRSDHPTRHVLVAAGLSFLLGLGFNQLVLLFVQRVRPYDAQITHLIIDRSADFSFPSDHATASFAIAAAFLLHGLPKRGFVFLAAAVLLAVSRVYIGTHYVGDVLGGAVTGIVAAFVVRAAYREGSKLDRLVTSIL